MKRPASLLELLLADAAADPLDELAKEKAVPVAVCKLLGTVMLLVGVRTGMVTLPVPEAPRPPVTAGAVGPATKVVMDMVDVMEPDAAVPLPAGLEAPPLGLEMPNWVEYW